MKVTPNVLISEMTGRVFGQNSNISMRMQNGVLRSYTYKNKPTEWSAEQAAGRQLFGSCAHMAKLILQIDGAAEHFIELRRKGGFLKLNNYVAKQVKTVCEEDEQLKSQVLSANEAYKRARGKQSQEEALESQQMALAEAIWRLLR